MIPLQSSTVPETRAADAVACVDAAGQRLAQAFASVSDRGQRIVACEGAVSDADRAAWVAAQAVLRDSVTAFALAVSALPAASAARAEAGDRLARMSEQLGNVELPVLARLDPPFGCAWLHHTGSQPAAEGAMLDQRLGSYGLTRADLQRYVLTGREPGGFVRALVDARRTGAAAARGVLRAALRLRAGYLRATTAPGDAASRKLADALDAAAAALAQSAATGGDRQTATQDETRAAADALSAGAGRTAGAPDAQNAGGASASTRRTLEHLAHRGHGDPGRTATPMHGVPLSARGMLDQMLVRQVAEHF